MFSCAWRIRVMQIQKHRGGTSQYHLFPRTLCPLFFVSKSDKSSNLDAEQHSALPVLLLALHLRRLCLWCTLTCCLWPTWPLHVNVCICLIRKWSYICMGVVEISTHSSVSQQDALNTKIFSSVEQRPRSSGHITPLPALVSSRPANNTLFSPNKSSRVQRKLRF